MLVKIPTSIPSSMIKALVTPRPTMVRATSVIAATGGGLAEEYRGMFAAGRFACVLTGGQLNLIYPSQQDPRGRGRDALYQGR
jgi:hypothetical protein